MRMKAEISWGRYSRPRNLIRRGTPGSSGPAGSTSYVPISRLTSMTVFSGSLTRLFWAGAPTMTWPSGSSPTTDGTVVVPRALSMMRTSLPSQMDTAEYVVPRSIPITLWKGMALLFAVGVLSRPGSRP